MSRLLILVRYHTVCSVFYNYSFSVLLENFAPHHGMSQLPCPVNPEHSKIQIGSFNHIVRPKIRCTRHMPSLNWLCNCVLTLLVTQLDQCVYLYCFTTIPDILNLHIAILSANVRLGQTS